MSKKTLLRISLGVFVVVVAAGVAVRQQFYGNAVAAEHDLYVSGRAEYGEALDSLLPHILHRRAFGPMPGGSVWNGRSSPGTMC